MSRRNFIESNGGTCKNWRWSWSFVNHDKAEVYFGAWDVSTSGNEQIVLKDEWEINPSTGKRHGAFSESIEYINLIEYQGYALKTFQMQHGLADPYQPKGAAKIEGFSEVREDARLVRANGSWLAILVSVDFHLPDEEPVLPGMSIRHLEGARTNVNVNRVERSAKARAECIKAKGLNCLVCGLNFADYYGEIGTGFIHVHHVSPIAETEGEYRVDPVNDLEPVCPNCHAMLHMRVPPLKIEELRKLISETKS